MEKPVHVKPSLYAFYFEALKVIALKYGYNLVLHGSMARDLDLVAIPWAKEIGDKEKMIAEFAESLGGEVLEQTEEQLNCFPNGRQGYVININRGEWTPHDPQYYLDISVIPTARELLDLNEKKYVFSAYDMKDFAKRNHCINVGYWGDALDSWLEKRDNGELFRYDPNTKFE